MLSCHTNFGTFVNLKYLTTHFINGSFLISDFILGRFIIIVILFLKGKGILGEWTVMFKSVDTSYYTNCTNNIILLYIIERTPVVRIFQFFFIHVKNIVLIPITILVGLL